MLWSPKASEALPPWCTIQFNPWNRNVKDEKYVTRRVFQRAVQSICSCQLRMGGGKMQQWWWENRENGFLYEPLLHHHQVISSLLWSYCGNQWNHYHPASTATILATLVTMKILHFCFAKRRNIYLERATIVILKVTVKISHSFAKKNSMWDEIFLWTPPASNMELTLQPNIVFDIFIANWLSKRGGCNCCGISIQPTDWVSDICSAGWVEISQVPQPTCFWKWVGVTNPL